MTWQMFSVSGCSLILEQMRLLCYFIAANIWSEAQICFKFVSFIYFSELSRIHGILTISRNRVFLAQSFDTLGKSLILHLVYFHFCFFPWKLFSILIIFLSSNTVGWTRKVNTYAHKKVLLSQGKKLTDNFTRSTHDYLLFDGQTFVVQDSSHIYHLA